MIVIELAGIRIRLENRFPFIERQCQDFLCEGEDAAFSVSVSPEEILEEQKFGDFSDGYCESICLYRHICEKLPEYQIFLMHSSVVEVDGYAYAFTAKSGVGKSTHTALWLKNVPHARVLNGDKPLYRLESDGSLTAFGTPWNGKENWGENISAPLAAICFIERGETNSIRRASEEDAIGRLMHQLYLRGTRESVNQQLFLMDALVRAVPYYVLTCNISDEAALLAWNTMRRTEAEKEI
ncbi:MAG: hypothetical protein IKC59_02490 [Clostridia bacterium]|nr:hypothetical protein [Clostridia bacterium]